MNFPVRIPSLRRVLFLLKTKFAERRSRSRLRAAGLCEDDIAIDCGANVGEMTALMRASGATVHAFEPNPHAFAALQKRFAGDAGVICHPCAVSDAPGTVRLFLHVNSGENPVFWSNGSSLLAEKGNVNREDFVEVEAVDLSAFIASLTQRVKVLKMDVEGVECRILRHLIETGMIERIDRLFVETHDKKIPAIAEETRALRELVRARGWEKKIDLTWV
jgi:FkbM family methyltransferase